MFDLGLQRAYRYGDKYGVSMGDTLSDLHGCYHVSCLGGSSAPLRYYNPTIIRWEPSSDFHLMSEEMNIPFL